LQTNSTDPLASTESCDAVILSMLGGVLLPTQYHWKKERLNIKNIMLLFIDHPNKGLPK
jgi:hypothetical protein